MKVLKQIILASLVILISACDNYIDVIPDNIATIDNAFAMRNEAEKFLFTCYSYMPNEASGNANAALLGGDEIYLTTNFRDHFGYSHPWNLQNGNMSASRVYFNWWDGGLFKGLNDCNIFLDNIGRVPDMDQAEINRWKAEVEFLKAYYHFYLVRMFGPIPIHDETILVSESTENIKSHRNTLDECFDYIVNKLDDIIESGDLPDEISNEADELGRITQGIALALKAKVLVTAASPLFNGNGDYSGFVDNRDIEIFSPNKTDEEKQQRWVMAREACREAILYLEEKGHTLYYYDSPEYKMSEQTKRQMHIRNAYTEKWNKEIIWAGHNSWGSSSFNQRMGLPRGLDPKKAGNTEYCSNYSVPIKIAEQFYTKNGVPIDEDKTWPYEDRLTTLKRGSEETAGCIASGYETSALNFDRETRFYASLGFDGNLWWQGITKEEDIFTCQSKGGQPASPAYYHTWNDTGYWAKKLAHMKTSYGNNNITTIGYPVPIIRLSDLYLLYAEATNECEGTSVTEVFHYVNKVRERASLATVQESWDSYSSNPSKYKSKVGRREIIQQERLIELVFESERFWDLRRWKTAPQAYSEPITGWSIGEKEQDYYNVRLLLQQDFTVKDYFFPISIGELLKNGNLVQNYGW